MGHRVWNKLLETWHKFIFCAKFFICTYLCFSSFFTFAQSETKTGAFYVNWGKVSETNLKQQTQKLDVFFPCWLTVNEGGNGIVTKTNAKTLSIVRNATLEIVPVLGKGKISKDNLIKKLKDESNTNHLIDEIVNFVVSNQFAGLNLDFEYFSSLHQPVLLKFCKSLRSQLNQNGKKLYTDIYPQDKNYLISEYVKVSDFVVLMCYDQYNARTQAGAVGGIDWIANICNENKSFASKIWIGFPTYGYEWSDKCRPITYPQLLQRSNQVFVKDDVTKNIKANYEYNGKNCITYFAGYELAKETLEMAEKMNFAGVCFWRMGCEDPKIWDFFVK